MIRDLTALADGTLPPKRLEPLLRRVSASPNLARALEQQRIAIDAIRRLDTPAPKELHERIQRATREACATQQSVSPPAHAGPSDRDESRPSQRPRLRVWLRRRRGRGSDESADTAVR